MKKIKYLILLIVLSLFVGFNSINVDAMKFDDKNPEQLAAILREADPGVGFAFIIGEYAFTSPANMTSQDYMWAATSIKGALGPNDITLFMVFMFNLDSANWIVEDVFGGPNATELTINYINYAPIGDLQLSALRKELALVVTDLGDVHIQTAADVVAAKALIDDAEELMKEINDLLDIKEEFEDVKDLIATVKRLIELFETVNVFVPVELEGRFKLTSVSIGDVWPVTISIIRVGDVHKVIINVNGAGYIELPIDEDGYVIIDEVELEVLTGPDFDVVSMALGVNDDLDELTITVVMEDETVIVYTFELIEDIVVTVPEELEGRFDLVARVRNNTNHTDLTGIEVYIEFDEDEVSFVMTSPDADSVTLDVKDGKVVITEALLELLGFDEDTEFLQSISIQTTIDEALIDGYVLPNVGVVYFIVETANSTNVYVFINEDATEALTEELEDIISGEGEFSLDALRTEWPNFVLADEEEGMLIILGTVVDEIDAIVDILEFLNYSVNWTELDPADHIVWAKNLLTP